MRKTGDDHQMEFVYKGGQTFFVNAAEHDETNGIVNFHKWKQAFRIFSNIYTQKFPGRAVELIQYNHVIFTAASAYIRENVYAYDREFCYHMSKFLNRNWSIIFQQAWTMILKDRLKSTGDSQKSSNGFGQRHKKEICKCFNKGLCTAGTSCKYDHRCLECRKFGHGAHICRKCQSTNFNSDTVAVNSNNTGVTASPGSNQNQRK